MFWALCSYPSPLVACLCAFEDDWGCIDIVVLAIRNAQAYAVGSEGIDVTVAVALEGYGAGKARPWRWCFLCGAVAGGKTHMLGPLQIGGFVEDVCV